MDTKSIIKQQLENHLEDISKGADPDWILVAEGDIEVVLDVYTYATIHNIKYYMHKHTLRCLIEMPDNKWSAFIIENHYNGPKKEMLRYLHDAYVKDHVRYSKYWCFGLLIKDPRADSEYTICTLKALDKKDFETFAIYILEQVKPQKGLNLIDRFELEGSKTRRSD